MNIKDILWVEDQFCERESALNEYFGECYKERVLCPANFGELSDILSDNSHSGLEKYDLIVLDIRLIEEDYKYGVDKLHDKLSEQISEESGAMTAELAGVFIYLYLIAVGYPKERIVILSGNTLEKDVKALLREGRIICLEKNILAKADAPSPNDPEEEGLFDPFLYRDEYYRLRYTVFSALEYWEKELRSIKSDKEIALNNIFETNYSADEFLTEFSKIKNLFSVTRPSAGHLGETYFLVLRSLARFHEDKCDMQKPNDKLYGMHNLVRQFRNWTSHGILTADGLDTQRFIILFFAMLRVLFDKKQIPPKGEPRAFDSEPLDYEKIWFTADGIDASNLIIDNMHAEKLKHCWLSTVEKAIKNMECRHSIKTFGGRGFLSDLIRSYYSQKETHETGFRADYTELLLLAVDKKAFFTKESRNQKGNVNVEELPDIKLSENNVISVNVKTKITVEPNTAEFTGEKLNTDTYHFLQKHIISLSLNHKKSPKH